MGVSAFILSLSQFRLGVTSENGTIGLEIRGTTALLSSTFKVNQAIALHASSVIDSSSS